MVGLNGMAKANSMLDHDAITESMDSFKRSDAAREELLAVCIAFCPQTTLFLGLTE
jgi:hypothetical protein